MGPNNPMRAVLVLAAGTEVITGLVLIAAPDFFTHLIFGGDLSAAGRGLGPLAGIALLALAWACWPRAAQGWTPSAALQAFAFFSLFAAAFLAYCGLSRTFGVGVLLWPAAILHATLAVVLATTLSSYSRSSRPT